MKNSKNIFITTLGYTPNKLDTKYYYTELDNKELSFCTGIAGAEAGAKLVLSQTKLDIIVVLCPPELLIGRNFSLSMNLKDYDDPIVIDVEQMNEADFLLYRLNQFIGGIDIEANQVLFNCSFEDRKRIKNDLESLVHFDTRTTRLRDYIINKDMTKALNNYLSKCDAKDIPFVKSMLYSDLSSNYKMNPLVSNQDLKIIFIPMRKDARGNFSLVQFRNVMNSICNEENERLNIYADLEGMEKGDFNLFWTTLSLFSNTSSRLELKSLISVRTNKDYYVSQVNNSYRTVDISKFLSAIKEFSQTGRTSSLKTLLTENDIRKNKDFFVNFVNALSFIDTGVSLCNIDTLTFGMKCLKKLLENNYDHLFSENEKIVYNLFKEVVYYDYGNLLKTKTILIPDLLEWAIKKDLFQQALTIIEAIVPKDVVERGIYFYASNKDEALNMMEKWNVLYWNEIPKCRFIFSDIDHYFIKSYGRHLINNRQSKEGRSKDLAKLHIDTINGRVPEAGTAYSNVDNDDLLYEFLLSYYNIGNLRNEVAHALTSDKNLIEGSEEIPVDNTFEVIRNALKTFLGLYRSATKKALSKQSPTPVYKINDNEFKNYTATHKLQSLTPPSDNNLINNCYEVNYDGKSILVNIHVHDIEDNFEENSTPQVNSHLKNNQKKTFVKKK